MAAAKQLENKAVCSICLEVYVDPRILRCGHTFCCACLEKLSTPVCPLCGKQFKVDDLTKNFALADVIFTEESSTSRQTCTGGGK